MSLGHDVDRLRLQRLRLQHFSLRSKQAAQLLPQPKACRMMAKQVLPQGRESTRGGAAAPLPLLGCRSAPRLSLMSALAAAAPPPAQRARPSISWGAAATHGTCRVAPPGSRQNFEAPNYR